MPLYARSGAIIPLSPVMQHTDERQLDELTLKVYPGSAEWTLYEDDGHTFAHQQGGFATTAYRVHSDGKHTTLEVAARAGRYQPPMREVLVEVPGCAPQRFNDDGGARSLTF